MIAYEELINPLIAAWRSYGGEVSQIAEFEGYPVYGLDLTNPGAKQNILLTSGIHGDEIGALYGLVSWLKEDFKPASFPCNLTVLPCLNPGGFLRKTRETASKQDLNRLFGQAGHPVIRGIHQFLQGRRFTFSLDFHEDLEMETFYLWEIAKRSLLLSRRLIASVKPLASISDEESPDGVRTRAGIIPGTLDEVEKRMAKRLSGEPFAYFVAKGYADYSITTELPGRLELTRRIRIQKALLETMVSYLCEERLDD